jgi:hypothetical protein
MVSRDVVGVVQGESGHLLKPLAEFRISLEDAFTQLLGITRSLDRPCPHALSVPAGWG